MPSTTLKRSAAAVGVLAGLLAAAAPSSAQLPATASGYTPPVGSDKGSLAEAERRVSSPIVYVGTQVGSEGVRAPTTAVVVLIGANDYGFSTEAKGTQIGSEGRKP